MKRKTTRTDAAGLKMGKHILTILIPKSNKSSQAYFRKLSRMQFWVTKIWDRETSQTSLSKLQNH